MEKERGSEADMGFMANWGEFLCNLTVFCTLVFVFFARVAFYLVADSIMR